MEYFFHCILFHMPLLFHSNLHRSLNENEGTFSGYVRLFVCSKIGQSIKRHKILLLDNNEQPRTVTWCILINNNKKKSNKLIWPICCFPSITQKWNVSFVMEWKPQIDNAVQLAVHKCSRDRKYSCIFFIKVKMQLYIIATERYLDAIAFGSLNWNSIWSWITAGRQ